MSKTKAILFSIAGVLLAAGIVGAGGAYTQAVVNNRGNDVDKLAYDLNLPILNNLAKIAAVPNNPDADRICTTLGMDLTWDDQTSLGFCRQRGLPAFYTYWLSLSCLKLAIDAKHHGKSEQSVVDKVPECHINDPERRPSLLKLWGHDAMLQAGDAADPKGGLTATQMLGRLLPSDSR